MSVSIWNKDSQTKTLIAGTPADLVPTIDWNNGYSLSGSTYTVSGDFYFIYNIVSSMELALYIDGKKVSRCDYHNSVYVSVSSGFVKQGNVFTQSAGYLSHVDLYPVIWTRASSATDIINDNATSIASTWSSSKISSIESHLLEEGTSATIDESKDWRKLIINVASPSFDENHARTYTYILLRGAWEKQRSYKNYITIGWGNASYTNYCDVIIQGTSITLDSLMIDSVNRTSGASLWIDYD